MSIHPDPEMDKAMRRWRERAEVAEAAHQASEEERIQAEKVANALATDLDNWKRDFSFQHQRADKAEAELARLREEVDFLRKTLMQDTVPEDYLLARQRAETQRDTLLATLREVVDAYEMPEEPYWFSWEEWHGRARAAITNAEEES